MIICGMGFNGVGFGLVGLGVIGEFLMLFFVFLVVFCILGVDSGVVDELDLGLSCGFGFGFGFDGVIVVGCVELFFCCVFMFFCEIFVGVGVDFVNGFSFCGGLVGVSLIECGCGFVFFGLVMFVMDVLVVVLCCVFVGVLEGVLGSLLIILFEVVGCLDGMVCVLVMFGSLIGVCYVFGRLFFDDFVGIFFGDVFFIGLFFFFCLNIDISEVVGGIDSELIVLFLLVVLVLLILFICCGVCCIGFGFVFLFVVNVVVMKFGFLEFIFVCRCLFELLLFFLVLIFVVLLCLCFFVFVIVFFFVDCCIICFEGLVE